MGIPIIAWLAACKWHATIWGMGSIAQGFMFIALVVPIALIVWWVFSSLGRITRGVEDIAQTLRRMEQNGHALRQL
jgi:hypothetical protein